MKRRRLLKMLSTVFILSCLFVKAQEPYGTNKYIDKANQLTAKNLDSAIYYLKEGIDYYSEQKDTINLINNLCHLSEVYDNVLDYGKSYDPDGNDVQFTLRQYKEAGSYSGSIELHDLENAKSYFLAPNVSMVETIHIILKATDNGNPALSSYQRIIVTIEP